MVLLALAPHANADEAVPTPTIEPAPPTETTPPATEQPPPVADEPAPSEAPKVSSLLTIALNLSSVTTQQRAVVTMAVAADKSPDGGSIDVAVAGQSFQPRVAGGKASITLPVLAARSYEIVATYRGNDDVAPSEPVRATLTVRQVAALGLQVNSGTDKAFAKGETIWLRGKAVATSGAAIKNRSVNIYRYSGSKAYKVGSAKTSSNGWYAYSTKPTSSRTYRATYKTLKSPELAVTSISRRSIESRAAALAFLLGKAESSFHTSAGNRWRLYDHGLLAEVGNRTWLVRSKIGTKYLAERAVTGRLGVPVADQRCGLAEGGCLQHFDHGVIYVNSHAKYRAVAQIASANVAELLAVARSQVGYRESAPRKSKYNRWMGRTGPRDPWCGFFTAWASYASGNGHAVIRAKSFASMVRAERKRGHLKRTPAVGRLAYIDYFRRGTATHIGIVYKYDRRYIWSIEGNVSAGGHSANPRGVHLVKRKRSSVVFYANPRF